MPLTGAAAARLYDDHVEAVHALVTRRVGPTASPDIVAEAFEHASRTWEQFDLDRGTERLFLFGAATAVLRRHEEVERTHLRSLGPGANLASGITVVDPLVSGPLAAPPRVVDHEANNDLLAADSPATGSSASPLMSAVADLAPDDRDIVLLSLWEACPQGAIAQALDLPVGAVRSALGRIRRELKAAVAAAAPGGKRSRS